MLTRRTPTDVFGSGCHRPAQLGHKFFGIESYFNNVVEQSKERSQREGCHEQGHKAKLDDWTLEGREEHEGKSGLGPSSRLTSFHTDFTLFVAVDIIRSSEIFLML